MKKKIGLSMILCMLLFLVVGCGKKEQLTVYVAEEDALYNSTIVKYIREYSEKDINVVYFRTYEEMNEQLQTEISDGEGPDVMLFNSFYSDVDPYKLASGGTLLSLDEQVSDLSEEEYYGVILDSGKMNGHQYYVPLSWNILQVYSTQDKMAENGYSDDMYVTIPAEAEVVKDESELFLSTFQGKRSDRMNLFMEIAGTKIFDPATGEMIEKKEEIRKTAEFFDVYYDSFPKLIEEGAKYDGFDNILRNSFLTENHSFMNNLRFWETIYSSYTSEEMYFTPITRLDSDNVTAQVIQYGAINANTKNPEEAWTLLKYLLDAPISVSFSKYVTQNVYYAPINRATYDEAVTALASQKGPGPSGVGSISPLSTENAKVLLDIPERIAEAVIPNTVYGAIVQECMEPYLDGEDNFDNCYDNLLQRTELYLSE